MADTFTSLFTSRKNAQVAARAFAASAHQIPTVEARGTPNTAAESLTAGDLVQELSAKASMRSTSVVRVLTGKQRFSDAVAVLRSGGAYTGPSRQPSGTSTATPATSPVSGTRCSTTQKAAVDEADALFLFGACSSFVTYLIEKGEEREVVGAHRWRQRWRMRRPAELVKAVTEFAKVVKRAGVP